jgi:tetratricopeptide (TPR) repeat protein
VSTIRFLGILYFSAFLLSTTMCAQFSSSQGITVCGEVRSHADAGANDYLVELYDMRTHALIQRVSVSRGQFQFDHVPLGSYWVRLVTAPGAPPLVEEYHQFDSGGAPLLLDVPEQAVSKPISGTVSLNELLHPIAKKALRDAYEAQQFALANDVPKAIAKLEEAIRIDPSYRDAHLNLGVQYVHAGRAADAHAEFQKALDIGPPSAPIYADLALTSAVSGQNTEAESFARKALELDPANKGAQFVLERLGQR